ncbi:phage tail assembly chaperone G [Ligilactobacillus salivarius]|uniref:phage tail assembly chaperone G n=1 Tax=Ligilactobacillus salivarius TaxID=1624 RepID=UPI0016523C36|nr:hypothetical protein [Ligilactobacillus salivarius]MBC6925093.1 hypothetical protein [Ligilactobacillus salivarius]
MYDIELVIDGKKKKFERNYPPTLANITDAMKIQRIEIEMVNSGKSFYTDEQLDEREKRIADFAVRFWKNQFTAEDVLNGAGLKTVNVINKAVEDALGVERTEESDEKKSKK